MTTLKENTRKVGDSVYWGERGEWLIVLAMHRDSEALERSNFECAKRELESLQAVKDWQGEFCPVAIERFNHWAVGWVDYLVIAPECKEAVQCAENIAERLEGYPVLNEDHWFQVEQEEANGVWQNCYNWKERANYIRDHSSQFEFRGFIDMLDCVRGKYFAGYASELID